MSNCPFKDSKGKLLQLKWLLSSKRKQLKNLPRKRRRTARRPRRRRIHPSPKKLLRTAKAKRRRRNLKRRKSLIRSNLATLIQTR